MIMKKKFSCMIILYIIGIAVAVFLLVLTFSIPNDRIKQNVIESTNTLSNEGVYPTFLSDKLVCMEPHNMFEIKTLLLNNRITLRDNYTDALMLLHAAYDGNESSLERALAIYRYADEKDLPESSLKAIGQTNDNETQRLSYARYWHGYLVVLRPLLVVLNINQIRTLNVVLLSGLLIWIIYLMNRSSLKSYSGWMLYSLLFFMPFTVPFCMQFCSVTYILLLSIIFLLKFFDWLKQGIRIPCLFFIIGMSVAYVDLLTFPLVTFGIPILFVLLLEESQDSLLKKIIRVFCLGIDWSIGYVGLWTSKWIIASIVLHKNVLSEAAKQLQIRTSANIGETNVSPVAVWFINICNYVNIFFFIVILMGFIIIFKNISMKKNVLYDVFRTESIYLFVACTPFVWFAVFKNHSYIHSIYTFRCLFVTVFAIMIFFQKWREHIQKPNNPHTLS